MAKLVKAMAEAFRKPGQSLTDFAAEYKALSDEDKRWYAEAFEAEGTPIEDKPE